MSVKPVITYAGDIQIFKSFESQILQALPQETVEWKRSYGRPPKAVILPATFEQYVNFSIPPATRDISTSAPRLQGCKVLHTYWTDCSDVEAYKTGVKEDIQQWFSQLKYSNYQDWLIILVETPDARKANKLLPRTTVLDRIKSDFGGKSTERCLSVAESGRTEGRGSDSWQTFMFRLRQALMAAFSRALTKFEDSVRTQREHRNDANWNFCDYFLLQEELAFVFEMLGLFDEALVQYDELDALFTQFILNSSIGDVPKWLSDFHRAPNDWSGVSLDINHNAELRSKIAKREMTLIDFRNYLFQRQCALLLLSLKPAEVAHRCLPFVQNSTHELKLLNISIVEGGVQCWVLLTCLQILDTCQKQITSVSAGQAQEHFALLWNTAKDKLYELGGLCGLLPGAKISSTELHRVVTLFSGISDATDSLAGLPAPVDKLKDALSSKESFKKLYLELGELAMGTFKHCGRLRSARLVGRDLARFYVALDEPQKAAGFLVDLLRGYDDEKWEYLKATTHIELAQVYRSTSDEDKLIRAQAHIATYPSLLLETRKEHFLGMIQTASARSEITLLPGEGVFHLRKFQLQSGSLYCAVPVKALVEIDSSFPVPITCRAVRVSGKFVQSLPGENEKKGSKDKVGVVPSSGTSSALDSDSTAGSSHLQLFTNPLRMKEQKYFKQDNNLSSVAVVCPTSHKLLGRKDSSGSTLSEVAVTKGDFSTSFAGENIVLEPGVNSLDLEVEVANEGIYSLNQLLITFDRLEFIDSVRLNIPPLSFIKTVPTLYIKRPEEDLLAGIQQQVELVVTAGSNPMNESNLRLYASRGLTFHENGTSQRETEVKLPFLGPSESITLTPPVIAEMATLKEGTGIEHKITVQCPWQTKHSDLPLHFSIPFAVSQKLHTANTRKFVHVHLQGLTRPKRFFEVRHPHLSLAEANFKSSALANTELRFLSNDTSTLRISQDQMVNFLWELTGIPKDAGVPVLKADFAVEYKLHHQDRWQKFQQTVEIADYQTLYTVRSRVDPVKGSEFCRAGSLCHMTLTIESTLPTSSGAALMYEVLADQAMWAVCGRTAGVVSIDGTSKHSVTLDVMPLIGGFLPLPTVRLSKYIPADQKSKSLLSPALPRLEPFSPGQVYNWSKAQQVHVLAVPSTIDTSLS